jgi:hypothetical protein
MKHAFLFILALAIICATVPAQAQTPLSVRQEVLATLRKIKPPNTKHWRYAVKVPQIPRRVPDDLRIDLVFKDGHYAFEYVALRFEKRAGDPNVNVSFFSYGSALAFWKEIDEKPDTRIAKRGTISVEQFDRLATLAFLYYDSDIISTYVPQTDFLEVGGGSHTFSSGDGIVIIGVDSGLGFSKQLIRASGSLVGNDLRSRMDNDYDVIRPQLFWKVFHDQMEDLTLSDLEPSAAEAAALERLQEPPLTSDYKDYFRRALFVQILGEFGSKASLPFVRKLRESSDLEPDWHAYLQDDINKAELRIRSRH